MHLNFSLFPLALLMWMSSVSVTPSCPPEHVQNLSERCQKHGVHRVSKTKPHWMLSRKQNATGFNSMQLNIQHSRSHHLGRSDFLNTKKWLSKHKLILLEVTWPRLHQYTVLHSGFNKYNQRFICSWVQHVLGTPTDKGLKNEMPSCFETTNWWIKK